MNTKVNRTYASTLDLAEHVDADGNLNLTTASKAVFEPLKEEIRVYFEVVKQHLNQPTETVVDVDTVLNDVFANMVAAKHIWDRSSQDFWANPLVKEWTAKNCASKP